jgi:hypothetical protein
MDSHGKSERRYMLGVRKTTALPPEEIKTLEWLEGAAWDNGR